MLRSLFKAFFGRKINNTRVVPITIKVILIFTIFILFASLTSNYINLMFNRAVLIKTMKQMLVKDLKDMYFFCNTQYEIYQYNNKYQESINTIILKATNDFKNQKTVVLGIKPDGSFLFQASKIKQYDRFTDSKALDLFNKNLDNGIAEGFSPFVFNNEEYFGVYKYNSKWDIYIVKAEEMNEFYKESSQIFTNISIIILIITLASAFIGILLLQHITKYIHIITTSIMKMINEQNLQIIDLKGAPNDEITFLGTAFNSLSSTINNLLSIFRKFANQDVALKAYKEREIRLEGSKKELTMLFSDIKSFTNITETLGNDVIKLINIHYDRAIREIIREEGVIGSIIGDALLAVFGAIEDSVKNKSYQAVIAGYKIQDVAASLRQKMRDRYEELKNSTGVINEEEEKVYQAVLIEIGVGIDGGEVFYGNIGSYERMTNTVIGDTVNSSSRLEGLTRVYKVPVICSDYVKDDIEKNVKNHGLVFIELDMVQVKGKTISKKIFWPVIEKNLTDDMKKEIAAFQRGLESYYEGQWSTAKKEFKQCSLSLCDVFKERTSEERPENWKGIWTMTTK